ncbi:MAG: carotenoid biosynthesis protein [Chloroflexi bacterium]|nr:carotenoid biosynthesis protein [Chloroflexota bacterium]
MNADEAKINRTLELILLAAIVLLFVAHIGINLYHITAKLPAEARVPWPVLTVIFSSFVLAHAIYMLGWRPALIFYVLTIAVAFAFEYVGQRTGLIFGRYYYTDVLGYRLLGVVPAVIPLGYFMVLYPSHLIANLVIQGTPFSRRQAIVWLLLSALLTAMVITAWDLTMDPALVNELKAWVWLDGGPYFGVPFQNYVGWLVTTFTISALYRLIEQRLTFKPLGRIRKWIILLPLIGFGMLALSSVALGYPETTRVIAPFAMGTPLIAAILRLYQPPTSDGP